MNCFLPLIFMQWNWIVIMYWWSGSSLLTRAKDSPLIPGLNPNGRLAVLTEDDWVELIPKKGHHSLPSLSYPHITSLFLIICIWKFLTFAINCYTWYSITKWTHKQANVKLVNMHAIYADAGLQGRYGMWTCRQIKKNWENILSPEDGASMFLSMFVST